MAFPVHERTGSPGSLLAFPIEGSITTAFVKGRDDATAATASRLLNMQNKHRYLPVSLVALLIVVSGIGCSREAKKNRYLERANRYFQAEQYEKAEIEYLNVLRLNPQNPVAVTGLGLICFEQGRPG